MGQVFVASTPRASICCCEPDLAVWGKHSPQPLGPALLRTRPCRAGRFDPSGQHSLLRTRPCNVGKAYVASTPRASIRCCEPDRALWGKHTLPRPLGPAFVAANPTVHCGSSSSRSLGPAFVAAYPTVQCGAVFRRIDPSGQHSSLRTRPCSVGQAFVAFDPSGQHSLLRTRPCSVGQ